MFLFILGLSLFFIPHFYSALRSREVEKDVRRRLGYAKFMGLYSIVTLAGLILMIIGYSQIPTGALLYSGPQWLNQLSWVFMVPALILIVVANFPAGHIKRSLQHPMMIGILIWAVFHLVTGGELRRVILFGAFTAYALVSLNRAFARGTKLKEKPAKPLGDILSIAVGLVISAIFLHGGHQALFGVPAV